MDHKSVWKIFDYDCDSKDHVYNPAIANNDEFMLISVNHNIRVKLQTDKIINYVHIWLL